MVVESVRLTVMTTMWKIKGLKPGRVKPITTQKSLHLLILRLGIVRLAQYQDNLTEMDLGSCCWRSSIPVESLHCHKLVSILIYQLLLGCKHQQTFPESLTPHLPKPHLYHKVGLFDVLLCPSNI